MQVCLKICPVQEPTGYPVRSCSAGYPVPGPVSINRAGCQVDLPVKMALRSCLLLAVLACWVESQLRISNLDRIVNPISVLPEDGIIIKQL